MRFSAKTLLFCLCAPALLAACSSNRTVETPEDAGANFGVNVETDANVHIVTSQGTFDGGKKIPEDWPSDIATYPGVTVEYFASVVSPEGDAGLALTVSTTDSIKQVVDFYKQMLITQGWTIQSTLESGDATIIAAEKDDRALATSISTLDGKTTVSLGVGKK